MFYKITLTASGGLTEDQIEQIKHYFETCDHVFLINEFGQSGSNSHVEGVVEFDTKKTWNVTQRVKTLYEQMGIEIIPRITFKVKAVTHLIGAIIYAQKELEDKGKIVLLKGWTSTWIDKQVKDNVKDIPHKMLKKKGTRVTQGTGPALLFEWCKANNQTIRYKQDYLAVIRSMADEGYMFGMIRHIGLYPDVCALFGDGIATVNVAESELRFVD